MADYSTLVLTGKSISASYQNLVEVTGSTLVGADGNVIYVTASYASSSVSSSYSLSSSFSVKASSSDTVTSASYGLSSSFAITSSRAISTITSSNANTSSWALNSISSSFSITSSYGLSSSFALTANSASGLTIGTYSITSSQAVSSSFSISSSYSISSSFAISSSRTISASYASSDSSSNGARGWLSMTIANTLLTQSGYGMSASRVAVGQYPITFSATQPNTNYAILFSGHSGSLSASCGFSTAKTTTAFLLNTLTTIVGGSTIAVDFTSGSIGVFSN